MPRFTTTVHINKPIAEVFDYVTTPANWPAWHVTALGVGGQTDHSLEPGEACTEDVKILGRRSSGEWKVVKRVAPHRWVIQGRIAGGGSAVITYALQTKGKGTTFTREVVYKLPALLSVVNGPLVQPRLEAEAKQSLQRLKAGLEATH